MVTDSPNNENTPLFSILIPVRDDLVNLKECLRSLSRESHLDLIEVRICDDGSSPPLETDSLPAFKSPIHLSRIPPGGPAQARNCLAGQARGNYLFFVDADTEFSGNTLKAALRIVESHPGLDAFIGSYDDQPRARTVVSMYKNLSHHWIHHASAGRTSTFWTGCGVIKKKVFLEFDGFNEHYLKPSIEDIELGMRLAAAGREIRIFPQMQVKHNKCWTLKTWLETDLFLRGIPWVRLMKTRRQWLSQLNFTPRQKLSAFLALALAPLMAAAVFYPPVWTLWGFTVVGFLLLNLEFFRFLYKASGFRKMAAMIPLHVLYYLTAAVSLALGITAALLQGPLEQQKSRQLQRESSPERPGK